MPPRTTPEEGGSPDEGRTATTTPERTFAQDEVDEIVERRLRRERAKYSDYDDLRAKAEKLDKLENDGQSEIEKATRRADEAERKAATAEARALRLEIATEKGLSPSQAKRLVGSTREELEADADDLLETFGARKGDDDPGESEPKDGTKPSGQGPQPDPRRRPQERLRSGAVPEAEPEKTGKEIAAEIAAEDGF